MKPAFARRTLRVANRLSTSYCSLPVCRTQTVWVWWFKDVVTLSAVRHRPLTHSLPAARAPWISSRRSTVC